MIVAVELHSVEEIYLNGRSDRKNMDEHAAIAAALEEIIERDAVVEQELIASTVSDQGVEEGV